MINYKIENGLIDHTKTHDSVFTAIYFSLTVKRGSWFFNKNFGCRWHTIKKLTNDTIAQAEDFGREALQWLVDMGRLKSFDVLAERDLDDANRCNVRIQLTKQDNSTITFFTFFMVI